MSPPIHDRVIETESQAFSDCQLAEKARRELFTWKVAGETFVVQLDPYFHKIRRVWQSEQMAALVRMAVGQNTLEPWKFLAKLFADDWYSDHLNYAGVNLEQVDPVDSAARQIEKDAISALQPWLIYLEVNQVCNLKCRFCYVDLLPRVVGAKATLHAGVARAHEAGALFLNITGGEPSLCDGLPDLVLDGVRRGLAVTIRTNLLRLPPGIERIAGESRAVFVTSFHHSEEDAFDDFVGKPGAKRQILRNIEALQQMHIRVRVHLVATKANLCSLPEMLEEFRELGVPYTLTDHVMPYTGERTGRAEQPLDFKILAQQTQQLITQRHIQRQRGSCTAAQSKLWLSATGLVYPCELFRDQPIGNYLTNSLRDILDSRENAEWRQVNIYSSEPSGCRSCTLRTKCPRCPAMVYLEKGTTNAKHDLTCHITTELGTTLSRT
jgi:radical SAM protein with 4Fe4S-binding SPASM domain